MHSREHCALSYALPSLLPAFNVLYPFGVRCSWASLKHFLATGLERVKSNVTEDIYRTRFKIDLYDFNGSAALGQNDVQRSRPC